MSAQFFSRLKNILNPQYELSEYDCRITSDEGYSISICVKEKKLQTQNFILIDEPFTTICTNVQKILGKYCTSYLRKSGSYLAKIKFLYVREILLGY